MFVVCGEALLDLFATGETPVGLAMDARVGGSPFNVAVGLARLGQPVSFLGGVSAGFTGERLMRTLAEEGVGTQTVRRLDAPTTLSLVGLDAKGVPSYAFYGEGCADRVLPLDAIDALPPAAACHFGSYAMVVEPVAGTQRALVERERARCVISYDPNVRLNVEPDLQRWRDVLAWMLDRAHLVKISEEDLSLLWPGASIEETARDWLRRGPELVVVTRGGEGALAWTSQASTAVPAVPCAMVDTVGAGDSFQAALLTWLAEHDKLAPGRLKALAAGELDGALRFASRAASITCSRRGADLPRRGELTD